METDFNFALGESGALSALTLNKLHIEEIHATNKTRIINSRRC